MSTQQVSDQLVVAIKTGKGSGSTKYLIKDVFAYFFTNNWIAHYYIDPLNNNVGQNNIKVQIKDSAGNLLQITNIAYPQDPITLDYSLVVTVAD